MGQLVEIGNQPGKAAPGEYGPNALLTARGDIIVRDSTGVPARHALGAAGKFLGSDGTDLLDRYPPGYLLVNDRGTSYSNSASETSVLSAGAVSNAYPAGVAVGDTVRIRAAGTWLNNSGGNQTLTINLYMASTIIATAASASTGANASTRNWWIDVDVIYDVIAGAGSGAIKVLGAIMPDSATGTGFQNAASGPAFSGGASTTIATNAASNLDLKTQTNNGTATTTVLCNALQARWFPKNY